MKDRTFFRVFMIVAGLLAAMTIVISPAFREEAERVVTELKADAGAPVEDARVSVVSSDAVISPQAVEVEPANPFVIQEIIVTGERPSLLPAPVIALPAIALTTLLRSVISPQAP